VTVGDFAAHSHTRYQWGVVANLTTRLSIEGYRGIASGGLEDLAPLTASLRYAQIRNL
jgi:hypothetical protein